MRVPPYTLLMVSGIVITASWWLLLARTGKKFFLVYVGGLLGAFLGAKLAYLAAEGWLHFGAPQMWLHLATGKSIAGALLGGYAGVELAKSVFGISVITGDRFALIAPLGITLGRVGCLLQGCCLGVQCQPSWFTLNDAHGLARWPAVPFEIGFNLVMLALFIRWRVTRTLMGQHFHVYLIAYGIFRFVHEFARETPKVFGGLSGYQLIAIAMAAFGALAFSRRKRQLDMAQAQTPTLRIAPA